MLVYGISPDVETGNFKIQEAEVSYTDYLSLLKRGACWTSKTDAEKALKKFVKQYNKRK